MLKNIDYSLISKANVSFSLYIIPLTLIAVIFLVFTAINFQNFSENFYKPSINLFEVIGGILYVMVMSFIIWGPMLLFMFVIEQLFIHKSATEKTVIVIFIIEIICVGIALPIILEGFSISIIVYFLATVSLAQILRLWRLNAKDHLYNSAPFNGSKYY